VSLKKDSRTDSLSSGSDMEKPVKLTTLSR
jgi:hypothetical protein